ncbi:hypothetical protein PR048_008483 [Dryococelus australis]|uniref:Uncharacterized protein n=1 Tax=Dryococelus australis TaxID=614101 RepID=A0ABQ9HX97_9NEOP|nr:hypothetical protein PR048_008483 [Dryococelus australis]
MIDNYDDSCTQQVIRAPRVDYPHFEESDSPQPVRLMSVSVIVTLEALSPLHSEVLYDEAHSVSAGAQRSVFVSINQILLPSGMHVSSYDGWRMGCTSEKVLYALGRVHYQKGSMPRGCRGGRNCSRGHTPKKEGSRWKGTVKQRKAGRALGKHSRCAATQPPPAAAESFTTLDTLDSAEGKDYTYRKLLDESFGACVYVQQCVCNVNHRAITEPVSVLRMLRLILIRDRTAAGQLTTRLLYFLSNLSDNSFRARAPDGGTRKHLPKFEKFRLLQLLDRIPILNLWTSTHPSTSIPFPRCAQSTQPVSSASTLLRFVLAEPTMRRRSAAVEHRCSDLRLACPPPTKANRVQSPAGSPDFRKRRIVSDDAVGRRVFSGISRFPRPSFQRRSIFTTITLIGSQDLAVKSRPNLFPLLCRTVAVAQPRNPAARPRETGELNKTAQPVGFPSPPRLVTAFRRHTCPPRACSAFSSRAHYCLFHTQFSHMMRGAVVAEWLACSPATQTGFHSRPGHS